MPFPEAPRVLYHKSTLTEVVCQLRFPAILKIDSEIPAAFQELVRQDYPEYTESVELRVEIQKGASEQLPRDLLRQAVQSSAHKNYLFATDGAAWRVNLTRTFLALTTNSYERWETFRDRVATLRDALVACYAPAHLTRVGLRYVNVIRRSELGLAEVAWSDLLRPQLAALLGDPAVAAAVTAVDATFEVALTGGIGTARIHTDLVREQGDEELCFRIDADFFRATKLSVLESLDNLDALHLRSSRFIRWCVTDKLHDAMEPGAL